MIFLKILPGVLKELLKHVPTVFFQVVEWSEIAGEIPKLSRRILQKEGFQKFFDTQCKFLLPLHIRLSTSAPSNKKSEITKMAGEKWLELYFAQIFSPHGLFIDLRSQNFSFSPDEFVWYPTGAFTTLSENFRAGLVHVYDGFYLGDEKLYHQGLTEIGLMSPEWTLEDKKKLADLFKDQFGDADTSEVHFTLKHFNDSMSKIFNFILLKKRKMTKDFLYLGIYLVTLYSSLEKVGEALPVKEIYLRTREKFSHDLR